MDLKNAAPEEMAKLLQQVLHDTPDLITLIDAQGNFLYVNRVVAGLKVDDVIGAPFFSYVPPEYVDLAKSSLKKCLDTGEEVRYETIATGPNNTQAYYSCRMMRQELAGKQVILCISSDVTEHRSLEEKLKSQIKELELLNSTMVDRELKMTELKKERDDLKKRLDT
jgi:PAS domain S-box-containing protein